MLFQIFKCFKYFCIFLKRKEWCQLDKISKDLFIDAGLVENVENYIQEYNYPQKSIAVYAHQGS